MNQNNIEFEAQVLVEFYKCLFNCLGVEIADMVFFSNMMEKGILLERPEYLEQAYKVGTCLDDYVRGR